MKKNLFHMLKLKLPRKSDFCYAINLNLVVLKLLIDLMIKGLIFNKFYFRYRFNIHL